MSSFAADFIWVLEVLWCAKKHKFGVPPIQLLHNGEIVGFFYEMMKHHIGVREAWCKQNERVGVTENLVVASNQDHMFITQYHFFCACEQATHNCIMALSLMASSNKIIGSYEYFSLYATFTSLAKATK